MEVLSNEMENLPKKCTMKNLFQLSLQLGKMKDSIFKF